MDSTIPDRAIPGDAGTIASTGKMIGPYKLLEKIGEGGFGEVWLAEQKEPVKRRVAVKIVKLGMDTRQVVARFEAERQALALMDHPNIAKVLDGGATDLGRPYFVMEWVKGVPITQYCDRERLETKPRLDLFIKVCQAVQHAHQKGIIHRDIKPSNILVTMQDGGPVPKVIDFGIAKATQMELTEKTLHTQLNQFIGTPAYMSPEQAEMTGIDIDTRSDIYSLGVLLYELLTGSTPFDTKQLLSAGLDEMRRIIRELEPVRPSTRLSQSASHPIVGDDVRSLTSPPSPNAPKSEKDVDSSRRLLREVKGDLDWIVMKCLEKDRTRRYETANGLALDIGRHLNSEPITARQPTLLYRAQRFVARNRVAVLFAALVASLLFFGILFTSTQAIRARRAELGQSVLRVRAEAAQALEQENRRKAEAATLVAERNLYAADMLLAFQALEKGNARPVRQILPRYLPSAAQTNDMRGWEWNYLHDRVRSDELYTLGAHSEMALFALFLPDRRTLVSGGFDRMLRFWDSLSRSNVAALSYPFFMRSAALSPDGHYLAVGTDDPNWSVWDLSNREIVASGEGSSPANGTAFSPNGRYCAIVALDHLILLSVPGFQVVERFERNKSNLISDMVSGVAFSPDSETVAFCHTDDRIVLHNLRTRSETPLGKARLGDALSIAFSVDGTKLAASDRKGVQIWDPASGRLTHTLSDHREQVPSIDFSPDGSRFATASGDQTIKLYDAKTFTLERTFSGHEHEVHNVRFSPDSQLLVSASLDRTVRIWDVRSPPRDLRKVLRADVILPLRLGRVLLAETNSGQVSIFDSHDMKTRQFVPPPKWNSSTVAAINPAGDTLAFASSSGEIIVWNLTSSRLVASIPPSTNPPVRLAVSENPTFLAILRATQHTELWQLNERKLVRTFASFRSNQFTSGTDEVLSSQFEFFAHDQALVRLAGERDSGQAFEILRMDTFERFVIPDTHRGTLSGFALDPSAKMFASCAFDGTVKIWDIAAAKEIKSLGGQLIGYTSVAFSHDRTRLAAGAFDGTITLWDLNSFREVGHWQAHNRNCRWLVFLPGDECLVSGRPPNRVESLSDMELALWPAPKP